MQYWQKFEQGTQDQPPWTDRYPAQMPDGRHLTLPFRDFGDVAVAGLIANQASFHVLDRLQGRRVLLVDDVISTGRSASAGLALLRQVGITPVGLAVAMIQGPAWRATWPDAVEVVAAFRTPRFHRGPGGWLPDA